MKQHRKSIAFYLITIVFVVLLFRVVVQYGETHLRAPANVNGRYLSDRPLPGCTDRFAIELQQSGIYLNGRIVAADQPASAEGRPTLTGLWQAQKFDLQGTAAIDCAANQAILLQGTIREATLSGKLQFGNHVQQPFVAQREAAAAPTSD